MDTVIDPVETLMNLLHNFLHFPLVERPDDFTAEVDDPAGANEVREKRWADPAGRQAHHGVDPGDHLNHLPAGHDDAGPHAGQTQLRKAHADNRVLVPQRLGLCENDIRKGCPVGVVNNERNTFGNNVP